MDNKIIKKIEKVNKTRAEQEAEFKEFVSPWANPGCQICLGKGFSGWHIELESLIPCTCVNKNLEKAQIEKALQQKDGVIEKLRKIFKMN